jgi:hypothetical protein
MSLPEADFDTTAMALPQMPGTAGPRRRRPGDESLLVKFSNVPKEDKTQSEAQGRPIFSSVEYLSIRAPGSRDEVVAPVSPKYIERFPDDYAAFKQREDYEAIQGTMLSQWPGISRSQVEELKFFNVHTVEQLAAMPDGSQGNFMGVAAMRTRAKMFMEAAESNSINEATASELSDLKNENATLTAAMADLKKQMTELKASDPVPDSGRRNKSSGSGSRSSSSN